MFIAELAAGLIIILIGIWKYYNSENKTGEIISRCIVIAGILVLVIVSVMDLTKNKGNPYQENIGKYYIEECKPLVLSGGDTYGKINIINCNETILQVDAAEYDAAVRAYRKSVQAQN